MATLAEEVVCAWNDACARADTDGGLMAEVIASLPLLSFDADAVKGAEAGRHISDADIERALTMAGYVDDPRSLQGMAAFASIGSAAKRDGRRRRMDPSAMRSIVYVIGDMKGPGDIAVRARSGAAKSAAVRRERAGYIRDVGILGGLCLLLVLENRAFEATHWNPESIPFATRDEVFSALRDIRDGGDPDAVYDRLTAATTAARSEDVDAMPSTV